MKKRRQLPYKKIIGIGVFFLCYAVIGFITYGYADIACSTMEDNLCHVPYEPSGLQMLYSIIMLLPLAILSLVLYLVQRSLWDEISNIAAATPLMIGGVFAVWLILVEEIVTFPAGNDLFYIGSLILSGVSLLIVAAIILRQLYQCVAKYVVK